jgi:hypothetical protein
MQIPTTPDKEKLNKLFSEYVSKLHSSNFSLWTTLITLHSISIAAFSIILKIYDKLPPFIPSFLVSIFIFISFLSMWFMFINLQTYRNFYRKVIDALNPNNYNADNLQNAKDYGETTGKAINIREHFAKYSVILNFFIIFVVIAYGNKIFPFS